MYKALIQNKRKALVKWKFEDQPWRIWIPSVKYVCEDQGRIIATFYYREGPDDTYFRIYDGEWLNTEPYGVVHRITSDGTVKGAASFCLDWAFEQCGNLKIDTHRDNRIMQHMLEKNGFRYCGVIYTDDGSERMAYQKAE